MMESKNTSSTTTNRSSFYYYLYHLAFSVKFIISVFFVVILCSFLILIWGKSIPKIIVGSNSENYLEHLARQRHDGLKKSNGNYNKISILIGGEEGGGAAGHGKRLRTLSPDMDLAISQCRYPRETQPALLESIRLLDDDPACKTALFAAACRLERGMLYEENLPVTCDTNKESPPIVDNEFGPPKILFVLNVNSAAVRHVERLLFHIYKKTHFYLLLLPNCFSEETKPLRKLPAAASNIRVLPYTIDCPEDAAVDVGMDETPASWRVILKNASDWGWNYMLSLDAFDFPILNVDKLTKFLSKNAGLNFLESYSIASSSDYVRNVSVSVCQDGGRRWPIGQAMPPPVGPVYYQGPPWYLLTRPFLEYALQFSGRGGDRLAEGLSKFASFTPFPAQLLFHTLAHNGRFCGTFVNESLRLSKYHIFDRLYGGRAIIITPQQQEQFASWTFTPNDFAYIAKWRDGDFPKRSGINGSRPMIAAIDQKFFARRFDPTLNQQIIQDLETNLYGDDDDQNDGPPRFSSLRTPGFRSFWLTLWNDKMKNDSRVSIIRYEAVARLLGDLCTKRLRRCRGVDRKGSAGSNYPIWTELSLYRNFDTNEGLILSMNTSCSSGDDESVTASQQIIPLQCYVNFVNREKIKSSPTDMTDLRSELLHMRVGSDYDPMDGAFRNFAGSVIVDKGEEFGLRAQWIPSEVGSAYQLVWLDPGEVVAATDMASINTWATVSYRPSATDLPPALQYGPWTAALLNEGQVIGAAEFLVIPDSEKAYQRISAKDRSRWAKKFYEVDRLCVPKAFSSAFGKQCKCTPPPVPICEGTEWSTLASDAKSNFLAYLRSLRKKGH